MDVSMLNLDDVPEINLDLVAMKAEISRVQTECCRRGLNQTTKWLAEINFASWRLGNWCRVCAAPCSQRTPPQPATARPPHPGSFLGRKTLDMSMLVARTLCGSELRIFSAIAAFFNIIGKQVACH